MDLDDDPLGQALTSRRIPHNRSRDKQKGGKSKGSGKPFDPLRALGYYEVQIGSSSKRPPRHGKGEDSSPSPAWLEIHELTDGEDGFVGTFNLEGPGKAGNVSGICILAGSRKGLQAIIDGLEKEPTPEQEADVNTVDSNDNAEQNDDGSSSSSSNDTDDPRSTQELSDQLLNRRARAFEKNTFRNPKFWMRWKGHVHTGNTRSNVNEHVNDSNILGAASGAQDALSGPQSAPVIESNQAYVIFASNDCDRFEGTVTCSALGWDNAKVRGRKTRPQPTRCPLSWTAF